MATASPGRDGARRRSYSASPGNPGRDRACTGDWQTGRTRLLSLGESLGWQHGLETPPGTQATEMAVLRTCVAANWTRDPDAALRIAERRLAPCAWVPDPTSGWGARWRAVHAIARLRTELARSPVPASPSGMLSWYAESGYRVDRAHRRLELARTELGVFGELEDALTAARGAMTPGWMLFWSGSRRRLERGRSGRRASYARGKSTTGSSPGPPSARPTCGSMRCGTNWAWIWPRR